MRRLCDLSSVTCSTAWNNFNSPDEMFPSNEEGSQNSRPKADRPFMLASKLFAEFIGDFVFIFVGSMQALSASGPTTLSTAFAHGLTIFVLICSLGHISGGHFNPAVTLAVALSGKLKWIYAVSYMAAQLLGGLCGSLCVRAITSEAQFHDLHGGSTTIPANNAWHQALIVEIILTFILTQTVMLTAVDTPGNVLAPLAIGLSITVDIIAAGAVSGASMNPARSFGPAVTSSIFGIGRESDFVWKDHFVYWLGPFIGAFLTALLYRTMLGRGGNRMFF